MAGMALSNGRADLHFKVILTGDARVGKTSLLLQFKNGSYKDKYLSTVGIDFEIKTVKLEGKTFKLEIWDTSGEERYRTVTTSYYKGMAGVMIVFDITKRESFDNVVHWLEEVRRFAPDDVRKVLVGNKMDLTAEREVDYATAKEFADGHQMEYIETAAMYHASVDKAFKSLVSEIRRGKEISTNNTLSTQLTSNTSRRRAAPGVLKKFGMPVLMVFAAAASFFLVFRRFPNLLRIFRRR